MQFNVLQIFPSLRNNLLIKVAEQNILKAFEMQHLEFIFENSWLYLNKYFTAVEQNCHKDKVKFKKKRIFH